MGRWARLIFVMVFCAYTGRAGGQEAQDKPIVWPLIGPYVGVAGVAAIPEDSDTAGGIDIRGGYRFHQALAAELAFDWLHGGGDSSYLATINGRLNPIPATGRVQPYFLLGVGVVAGSADVAVAGRFAGGLEVYATRNIIVGFEAAFVKVGFEDEDFFPLQLGVKYQFGSAPND